MRDSRLQGSRGGVMEITLHDAVTVMHGMAFGGFLLLGFSGAGVALYAVCVSPSAWMPAAREGRFLGWYFSAMAALAWLTVFAGAYLVYPWYRARPPAGSPGLPGDLSGFPQRLLMSNPATTGWHDIGMEWKEHLAWFAPLCLTAVAYIFVHDRPQLRLHAPDAPCRDRAGRAGLLCRGDGGLLRRHAQQERPGARRRHYRLDAERRQP